MWIELSKCALLHNLAQYKKIIGTGVLAPVIKSNAYGHGIVEVARICQETHLVDWLCVAFLSEAVMLRDVGITKPILVLSGIDADPVHAVRNDIAFTVYDTHMLNQLNAVGATHNYSFPVHVKIDTGLSRFGILSDQVVPFMQQVQQCTHITLQGISSHFAESNNADQTFTLQQYALFQDILATIVQMQIVAPYVHMANSAATTGLPKPYGNFFRVGLGMYGLWPSEHTKERTQARYPNMSLKPVMSVKTRIMTIKTVPANSFVGYNRTYQTTRQTKLAILPAGYYDGYSTELSNRAMVRIRNKLAPVVGIIAMNTTSIDITDVPDVSIGDELLLMGNHPGITVYDLARYMGKNNVRHITTAFRPGVKRTYCLREDLS